MIICNLASGSSGNCTYVETKNYKILIDLGKTKKYIVNALKQINVDYKDIDYVFLTHSHNDHTSALKTFMSNHKATLVITPNMLSELPLMEDIKLMLYDDNPDIDGLDIKSYKMSHDVKDIRSFVIREDGSSFAFITDTGYINSKYFKALSNLTAYFMESNHDIEMLTHGPYPEWLQKRVLSDEGHLSNKFAGMYLSKMISSNTKNIILIHLSEKNNTEECALQTVKEELKDNDISNIEISCARPNEVGKVIII